MLLRQLIDIAVNTNQGGLTTCAAAATAKDKYIASLGGGATPTGAMADFVNNITIDPTSNALVPNAEVYAAYQA